MAEKREINVKLFQCQRTEVETKLLQVMNIDISSSNGRSND